MEEGDGDWRRERVIEAVAFWAMAVAVGAIIGVFAFKD